MRESLDKEGNQEIPIVHRTSKEEGSVSTSARMSKQGYLERIRNGRKDSKGSSIPSIYSIPNSRRAEKSKTRYAPTPLLDRYIVKKETRELKENEKRIIKLVASGLKNRDVGIEMGTTEHVVKNYLRVIYDKVGVWNRLELALWYEAHR